MPEDFKERLEGLENIIHGVYHNVEILIFMAFGLHRSTHSLHSNKSLIWIWSNTMAIQIIDFYKLINAREKFSFIKIINIAKNLKIKADYDKLEKGIDEITKIYTDQNYEAVRSKYLAHQDLNVPEIRTDLKGINQFSKKAIEIFHIFSEEFEYDTTEFDKEIESSFKEIFETIEKLENLNLFIFKKISGNEKLVEISELQKIIEKA
ncbi:hypothetical protein [uncultured Christiangramia sp.]|uniref:hypothetical protein n=1 Tax=Christiangramia sp. 3-2217-3z TaxID=3417564 RepID=UPI0026316F80|nr:hypothetical protein [uncultured Christiangramia sp.]